MTYMYKGTLVCDLFGVTMDIYELADDDIRF